MNAIPSIVVSAGFDDRDATTLRHAGFFARVGGAKSVYVVHVAPTLDLPPDYHAVLQAPRDEQIEAELASTVNVYPDLFLPSTNVRFLARSGSHGAEIVHVAAQKSADLVCLCRNRHSQAARLSESALHIVRKSPCSVLVAAPNSLARYDRILAPIDFSERSRDSLLAAVEIAKASPGATVIAQHVYAPPLGWHKLDQPYEKVASVMRGHAENRWNEMIRTINVVGVRVEPRFDLSESIPTAIAATGDEVSADLIVVGSHGRTQPAGILLGHVADAVSGFANRTVLCVKRKGEVVNLLRAILQFFEIEKN